MQRSAAFRGAATAGKTDSQLQSILRQDRDLECVCPPLPLSIHFFLLAPVRRPLPVLRSPPGAQWHGKWSDELPANGRTCMSLLQQVFFCRLRGLAPDARLALKNADQTLICECLISVVSAVPLCIPASTDSKEEQRHRRHWSDSQCGVPSLLRCNT